MGNKAEHSVFFAGLRQKKELDRGRPAIKLYVIGLYGVIMYADDFRRLLIERRNRISPVN
jgi:hypothetical protein